MLTSRERVMMAVNHRQPDRVPIDLGGHRSSGIMAIAYNKLKKYLGIEAGDIYVYDFIQQLGIIEREVLDRFGVDTIELGRGFDLRPEDWRDWVLPDGAPCKIPAFINPVKVGKEWHVYSEDGTLVAIQTEHCLYFEQTCWPLSNGGDSDFDHLEELMKKIMWTALRTPAAVTQYSEEGMTQLAAGAKALREGTDRAIIGLFGGNLHEMGQFHFGMVEYLTLLAGDKPRMHRFLDKLVEMYLTNLEAYLSAVGPYIDIIMFGDDLGMQTGPMISPRMFREFYFPRYKLMWERVKQLADVKIMLHSCGSVYHLLPGLIEAGIDIIQPVQTTAADMEPERLKREFGNDLCLWGGGCDTQTILARGTIEEIVEDVRQRVGVLAPGGGYVFQQVHNIMADVEPEKIVAMLDAVNS